MVMIWENLCDTVADPSIEVPPADPRAVSADFRRRTLPSITANLTLREQGHWREGAAARRFFGCDLSIRTLTMHILRYETGAWARKAAPVSTLIFAQFALEYWSTTAGYHQLLVGMDRFTGTDARPNAQPGLPHIIEYRSSAEALHRSCLSVRTAHAPSATQSQRLVPGGGGAHQGQTSREGEKDIWWTARTARGGTGHLGRTETQRGRLWTACGQRCVDSKNSQTTPATTSTSSIRQLLGAADTQTAHRATFSTVPTHQLLGSANANANAETTPARAPAAAADRKQRPDATFGGKNG